MRVSIVIRTYNESRYLGRLLDAIDKQDDIGGQVEIVLVDSGSSDNTVKIAEQHNAVIKQIRKSDFTFGRSLNIGCKAASGDILVMVSGHCIPKDNHWLRELIDPIVCEQASYVYGKQIGDETSRYSEVQLFNKTYSDECKIPQEGFFCNNANSALSRLTWQKHRFDEDLSGLEDMELAKRIEKSGEKIAYVSRAVVFHLHSETWSQVKRRFEREALALQVIMPEVQLNLISAGRFFWKSVVSDARQSSIDKKHFTIVGEILLYRFMQYWGAYKGNHIHRKLSRRKLEQYYYPE